MYDTTFRPVENSIITVACPSCGVAANRPCLRPSGARASEAHVARYRAALAAGRLERISLVPPLRQITDSPCE